MGLWVPNGSGDFTWRVSDTDGVRPHATWGTAITSPGTANVKGSYVSVLSALAFDVYGIFIRAADVSASGAATDTLLDIGVDPAGGIAFSVIIPDLLISNASNLSISGGVSYYFPLWIRAGSSLGIRVASTKTSNPFGVNLRVFGKPRDPKVSRFGTYVTSFGVNAAASNGTAVTVGTTSVGAWTALGSTLAKSHWRWQLGMGCSSVMTANDAYSGDLGVGVVGGPQVVISDQMWIVENGPMCCSGSDYQGEHYAATGDGVYVRSQCLGTPDAGITFAAYGLGG